ncbi:peptidase [candidate division KSB1 bacterium]|nr:peptidase [candidate division KSB1 bacterium]
MRNYHLSFGILLIISFLAGCAQPVIEEKAPVSDIQHELNKLAPVTLTADLSYLPTHEVQVIKLLVKASQHIDRLYLMQVSESNPVMMKELMKSKDLESETYLDFFKIMFGPWNRMEEDIPFINQQAKPKGAAYYPLDMTKDEFNKWIETHPEDRTGFESNFTVIRREDGALVAIPYSEYFEDELKELKKLLLQAADLTQDTTLERFLRSRAEAFLTDDYYQSDMDWMDLAEDIEVVIGPYEVYEDNLFGLKAAFESFICVVDHEASEKQMEIAKYLVDLEKALPIAEKHKNFDRGASSPIKVVNLLYSSGDTKAGIQTTAFNLPNDERVREAKGSKKVMLKNVMQAKFEKCWIPIVNTVLVEKDLNHVSFDAYFAHVLMHEVSHGLGPGRIIVDGRETTVNKELSDLYSTIEEAKADVLGIFTAQYLIDAGVFSKDLEKTLYASNLGGMFRSIRFGIDEAHGGGVTIQLNYYLDKRACTVDSDGRFRVNDRRMKRAVKDLAEDLLKIEAEGDYAAAKALIEKYRVIRPEVQLALDRLKDVPIDIRPIYPIEGEI